MANTKPTHEDWEDARQKRNEAAARFIWASHGVELGVDAHPDSPQARKHLHDFYKWDATMDRLGADLDRDREGQA